MLRTTIRRCAAVLLAIGAAIASHVAAQTSGRRTPEQLRASYEAHRGDFDYLLGDWAFTSVSKEFGTNQGVWSAVRMVEGGEILDEYRIVGDSGQTWYVTNTLRVFNAALDQWELVSVEQGTGLQNLGTAHKVGSEMHIQQRFGVGGPRPSLWRIRYQDIKPDRFSWTADRSLDEGKTWDLNHLQIQARRKGPARSMAPLTTASNAK